MTQTTKNVIDALADALTSKMIDHDIKTGISTIVPDQQKKNEIIKLLEKFKSEIIDEAKYG